MGKYIDADKLIERLEEMKRTEYENCGGVNSKTGALQEVQELIDSLQQEQLEVDLEKEITDKSRACCNCANATMSYPNCSCWQHKHCNGDRPYVILKEAWIKTAEECEEFEMGTCQEADVYLELHRIMSEESKDKNPKPMPSCKSCGFYENNCPYIRGKFIPYPKKVCKDYTYSVKQEQPEVDLEKACLNFGDEIGIPVCKNFRRIARHFYELGLNARKED